MHLTIISKERPNNILTAKTFKDCGPIYVFVEPQEVMDYKRANPTLKIVKIPKNNQGLSYVGNCVLEHFKGESVLLLDDDIIDIRKRVHLKRMKSIKDEPEEIKKMLDTLDDALVKGYNLVSISYFPSNWYEPKLFKINTRTWCIKGINEKCGVRFDMDCLSCADYDFTAQIIRKGLGVVVFYNWAFDCIPMTTNEGGCQSPQLMDRQERTLKTYEYLVSKWGPHVITAKKSEKLPLEIQFNWGKIRL